MKRHSNQEEGSRKKISPAPSNNSSPVMSPNNPPPLESGFGEFTLVRSPRTNKMLFNFDDSTQLFGNSKTATAEFMNQEPSSEEEERSSQREPTPEPPLTFRKLRATTEAELWNDSVTNNPRRKKKELNQKKERNYQKSRNQFT